MRFIDFFAGVGGFRVGMEMAGHECVGYCEIDEHASQSYRSMHTITDKQREYLLTLPLKERKKEIMKDEYLNGEWYADDICRNGRIGVFCMLLFRISMSGFQYCWQAQRF